MRKKVNKATVFYAVRVNEPSSTYFITYLGLPWFLVVL